MSRATYIVAWMAVLGCFAGLGWVDFRIWRIQHPTAPAWAFWLK